MTVIHKKKSILKITCVLLIAMALTGYGLPRKALLCIGNDGHVGIKTMAQYCCDDPDSDTGLVPQGTIDFHIDKSKGGYNSCMDLPILIVENKGQLFTRSSYKSSVRQTAVNNTSNYTISLDSETYLSSFLKSRDQEQGNLPHEPARTVILII